MKNFAIVGVAGFVAPRHLRAISDTGNRLIVALDSKDSVGILDNYFPETLFFSELELFQRFIYQCQYSTVTNKQINYLSICTPNYLHEPHIYLALQNGMDAICEKPLSIEPDSLGRLREMEVKTNQKIHTILQLRLHPEIIAFREKMRRQKLSNLNVCLTYVTRRGHWYHSSWKGDQKKSGGLAMNIGIHFFDILLWLFGGVQKSVVYLSESNKMSGYLDLENAKVKWYLSVDQSDLPDEYLASGRPAYRALTVNGEEINFSEGFTQLHTLTYRTILDGNGPTIDDARPSLELVHQINASEISTLDVNTHPILLDGIRNYYLSVTNLKGENK